ncbi:N-Dimethylarginine dimethylaminohydrolase [Planctomycetales bacterium 10988]|nr:N-Dimethylarginine dimethylaminohydrolase [Planctomycetales bacterium 10988]
MNEPRILMCPPDFYGIEYEINPWMDRRRQADRLKAIDQWTQLKTILTEAGAKIELLTPQAGLPDLVFTANSAIIYKDEAILARFRHPERQKEVPVNQAWFQKAGFVLKELPEAFAVEGAGDALFCGETLFAGYRMRSDALGHQQIGRDLMVQVLPLELIDPYYYHLDTCFCPLQPGVAIYYPGAFDEYGQSTLKHWVPTLIPVEKEEAERFACNAVVVDKTVVTNEGCPKLHQQLQQLGYNPIATPLDEFTKAGGSAKCLTLRLDGEEAAGWKYASGESTKRIA